jgi:hypothetical protein
VPERPADPTPEHDTQPAAGAPDPIALVREHVVPVLVDAGVLGDDEKADVVDAADPRPPAPPSMAGRHGVHLRVDTTASPTSPPGSPRRDVAGLDGRTARDSAGMREVVHVHIGRIEVVRPPVPPPAASPVRATASTAVREHAAYLARRRELS